MIKSKPSRLAIIVIELYQASLSKMLPSRCRFYPSCSAYARESISRFGVITGGRLAMARLFRCHPGNPGGIDPVPDIKPANRKDN